MDRIRKISAHFGDIAVSHTFVVDGCVFMRLDSNFNQTYNTSGNLNAIRLTKQTESYRTRLVHFDDDQPVQCPNEYVLAHRSVLANMDLEQD